MTDQLKTVIREALLDGQEVPATLVNSVGLPLAQGLLRWKGSALQRLRSGRATAVLMNWRGQQFRSVLSKPVNINDEDDQVRVEFGPAWQ